MTNLDAFREVLGELESGGNYTALYGGGVITDFSQFPQWDGVVLSNGSMTHSAGKYQFQPATWAALNLPDFTPKSQDIGATEKIKQQPGALDAINSGDIQMAVNILSPTWDSLRTTPISRINDLFLSYKEQRTGWVEVAKDFWNGYQMLPDGSPIDNSTIFVLVILLVSLIIGWVYYLSKRAKKR